jgi:DNA-binding NarL/FixJ family response regulator
MSLSIPPTLSKPRTKAIRILIADGHPVIRECLIAIFESQKDIMVVAEAADGEQACELCYQLCPDVLLLDLRIPGKNGFQVITDLMSRPAPRQRIVAMTTYESEEDRRRALKAGAEAYLVKGTRPQEIREAVRGAGSQARSCSLRLTSCGCANGALNPNLQLGTLTHQHKD